MCKCVYVFECVCGENKTHCSNYICFVSFVCLLLLLFLSRSTLTLYWTSPGLASAGSKKECCSCFAFSTTAWKRKRYKLLCACYNLPNNTHAITVSISTHNYIFSLPGHPVVMVIMSFILFQQETCKRHLMFTVPKVVALSPQQRLLEDDLTIVSLADVFKQVCTRDRRRGRGRGEGTNLILSFHWFVCYDSAST